MVAPPPPSPTGWRWGDYYIASFPGESYFGGGGELLYNTDTKKTTTTTRIELTIWNTCKHRTVECTFVRVNNVLYVPLV